MNWKLTVVLTVSTLSAFAQTPLRTYHDKDWKMTSSDQASFYREVLYGEDSLFHVAEFTIGNNKLMEGTFTDWQITKTRHGLFSWYYENGQVKESGIYRDGKKIGFWKKYYADGKEKEIVEHKKEKAYYHQHWDHTGASLLHSGRGTIREDDDHLHIVKEIQDSLLFGSYVINRLSLDTIYVVAEISAEFRGGIANFYRQVGMNVKYPASAKRMGIEGKVFVEFTIDKTGTPKDVKVLKGTGSVLDDEAVRIITKVGAWKPARHRGAAVRQKMVLPINFRLG